MNDPQLSEIIESLFQKNQYKEIENIMEDHIERLDLEILRIKLLRVTTRYSEALKRISRFIKGNIEDFDKAEVLIEKAHCYWYRDERDLVKSVLNQVDKLLKKIRDTDSIRYKRIKADYLHLRAIGEKNFSTTTRTINLLHQSIELKQEINAKGDLALSYNNLGYYYWMQNDFDEAIIYLKKSLDINESIENQEQIALNLLNLIQVSIADNNLEPTPIYLERLRIIHKTQPNNKLIDTYYTYSKGMILSQGTNIRKKIEAEDLFGQIVNAEVTISSLYIKSIFNLCTLYLYQLKIEYDDETFQKLVELIDKLYTFGVETRMGLTILKAEFLRAKIAAYQNDLHNAKNLFLKISDDAVHLGDVQMSKLVAKELGSLLEREKLAVTANSLKINLKDSDLDKLLTNFITNTNSNFPDELEIPISIIVLTQDGNQVYSAHFDESVKFNSFLVSSFLSAVNTFGNQIFGTEGGLDKIKHEDYNLLLRKKNKILYCYIYKGESDLSLLRLTNVIDEIYTIVDSIGPVVKLDYPTKIALDSKVQPIMNKT